MLFRPLSANVRLAGFYCTYFAGLGLFNPYWGLYLGAKNHTALEIGVVMSLSQFARIVGPAVAGSVADKWGKRAPVIQCLSTIAVLAFIANFADHGFTWQVVTLLVVFAAWTGTLPLVEATTLGYLGQGAPTDYGKIRLWGTVGFTLATVIAGYLIDQISIYSLPVILLAVLLLMAIWSFTLNDYKAPPARCVGASFWAITRKKEVLGLFGSCTFIVLAHGVYNAFYSVHLMEQGYSESTIGWMWVIGTVSEILIFIVSARLMQRFSVKRMYTLSFLIAGLRFILTAWLADIVWLMCLLQVLHAFTFAMHHVAAMAYLYHFYPADLLSRGQAMYVMVAYGVGATLGGLFAGVFWDEWGAGWVFTSAAVLSLFGFIITQRYLLRCQLQHI